MSKQNKVINLLDSRGHKLSSIDKTNAEVGLSVIDELKTAYDQGFQEGVKHVEMREKVNAFLKGAEHQKEVDVADGEIFQINNHWFGGGVYIRDQSVRQGNRIAKHRHDYDHYSILLAGAALVEVDDAEPVEYKAGAIILIEAGKEHRVTPVGSNIRWLCIHKSETDDVAVIGEVLTEKASA